MGRLTSGCLLLPLLWFTVVVLLDTMCIQTAGLMMSGWLRFISNVAKHYCLVPTAWVTLKRTGTVQSAELDVGKMRKVKCEK